MVYPCEGYISVLYPIYSHYIPMTDMNIPIGYTTIPIWDITHQYIRHKDIHMPILDIISNIGRVVALHRICIYQIWI